MRALLTLVFLSIFGISIAAPPPPPPAVYPFVDDFETYSPYAGSVIGAGWTETCSGTAFGFRAHGMPHGNPWPGLPDTIGLSCNFGNLWSCDSLMPRSRDSVITRFVGPLTGTSVVQFDYRIIDTLNYPQNGGNMGNDAYLRVSYSTTGTQPWSPLLTIDESSHVVSNAFAPVTIPIGQFASQLMYICVTFESGTGADYWVDIDNFNVGEPLITGLGMQNEINNIWNSQQTLYIHSDASRSYSIYSLDGKKQMQIQVTKGINSYSLQGLATGLYLVRNDELASKGIKIWND